MPIPTERNYKLQLIKKTELFIKKIWWKTIFYDMNLTITTGIDKQHERQQHKER